MSKDHQSHDPGWHLIAAQQYEEAVAAYDAKLAAGKEKWPVIPWTSFGGERLSLPLSVSSAAPRVPAPASPRPTSKRHRNEPVPMPAGDAGSPAPATLAAAQRPDLGLLEETRLSLPKERIYSRIKGIEVRAQPQGVKLVTALLHRLRQRRPHAASLVALQTQQANSRST
jgi:hypothetical protein